jgi:hypothetical protein
MGRAGRRLRKTGPLLWLLVVSTQAQIREHNSRTGSLSRHARCVLADTMIKNGTWNCEQAVDGCTRVSLEYARQRLGVRLLKTTAGHVTLDGGLSPGACYPDAPIPGGSAYDTTCMNSANIGSLSVVAGTHSMSACSCVIVAAASERSKKAPLGKPGSARNAALFIQ